jgi:alkylhydroperoxidase family enzyme
MDKGVAIVPAERIEQSILWIRYHRVMLDADLATLYGVETKQLIQAVKRNIFRFPSDFMFQLNEEEFEPTSLSSALAWTEAVTRVSETHVPDEVYEEVKKHFNEKELVDLTVAVATINAWNRLLVAGRNTPGTYQPVKRELKKAA